MSVVSTDCSTSAAFGFGGNLGGAGLAFAAKCCCGENPPGC